MIDHPRLQRPTDVATILACMAGAVLIGMTIQRAKTIDRDFEREQLLEQLAAENVELRDELAGFREAEAIARADAHEGEI